MKDEFTYPLQNFNGATVHPTFYWECEYLSMLELKLNQSSKKGPRKGDTVTTNEPEEATPICMGVVSVGVAVYESISLQPSSATLSVATVFTTKSDMLSSRGSFN